MQVKLMARALATIWVKLDDLSVLWCINHIKYVSLEHIFWLHSDTRVQLTFYNGMLSQL